LIKPKWKELIIISFLLLTVNVMSVEPTTVISNTDCLRQAIMALIDHLGSRNTNIINPSEAVFNRLISNSNAFGDWLITQKHIAQLKNLTISEKQNLINEYLGVYFKKIDSPKLFQLQEESLRQSLMERGIETNHLSPWQALDEVSSANKQRLLKQEVNQVSLDVNVENAVDQVTIYFQHNTVSKRSPELALLSARRMEEAGLGGGVNTQPFSKQFLKTDDNVYFYVMFRSRDNELAYRPSTYGRTMIAVEHDPARKTGVVSPYLMYSNDLAEIMKFHDPALSRRLEMNYGSSVPIAEKIKNPIDWEHPPEEWTLAKKQLYFFDFTPSDFEELIRTQLKRSLYNLKSSTNPSDQKLFSETIEKLHSHNDSDLNIIMTNLVFKPLGMPELWEMKVPVAVPENLYKVIH